jgi:hypothetical protein
MAVGGIAEQQPKLPTFPDLNRVWLRAAEISGCSKSAAIWGYTGRGANAFGKAASGFTAALIIGKFNAQICIGARDVIRQVHCPNVASFIGSFQDRTKGLQLKWSASAHGPGCVKIAQLGAHRRIRGCRVPDSVESCSCHLSRTRRAGLTPASPPPIRLGPEPPRRNICCTVSSQG